MIEKFKNTIQKFITWVCHKFSAPSEEALIRDFEKEVYTNINLGKELGYEQFDAEYDENEIEF